MKRYWYAPLREESKSLFTTNGEDPRTKQGTGNNSSLYVGEITKETFDTITRNRRELESLDEFGLPTSTDEFGL